MLQTQKQAQKELFNTYARIGFELCVAVQSHNVEKA